MACKECEPLRKAFKEMEEVLSYAHFMMMEGPELRKRLHKIITRVNKGEPDEKDAP